MGALLQSATRTALSPEEVAAYDAPFPDSTYQAGARVMPALVPISPDDPASEANRAAWEVLRDWSNPFVTFFSDGDPITGPWRERFLSDVPGALSPSVGRSDDRSAAGRASRSSGHRSPAKLDRGSGLVSGWDYADESYRP